MTVNIPDCRVRIGRTEMGVAPFFKKVSSGRCEIKVECLDGRKVMRELRRALMSASLSSLATGNNAHLPL